MLSRDFLELDSRLLSAENSLNITDDEQRTSSYAKRMVDEAEVLALTLLLQFVAVTSIMQSAAEEVMAYRALWIRWLILMTWMAKCCNW